MDDARDAALGEESLRTRELPKRMTKGWTGGTAYERSDRAVPVKDEGRAYTNANSLQPGVSIAGPTAPLKINNKTLEEDQELRRKITIVREKHTRAILSTINTSVTQAYLDAVTDIFRRTSPVGHTDKLEQHGSIINHATAGGVLQHLFSNVQVNIAPAGKSEFPKCTH
jgi:hypothetical protein